MKKVLLLLLFVVLTTPVFGNLRYIKFNTIPNIDEYENDILYILNNEYYMDTYIYKWEYDQSKKNISNKVELIFKKLETLLFDNNYENLELCLFLVKYLDSYII